MSDFDSDSSSSNLGGANNEVTYDEIKQWKNF